MDEKIAYFCRNLPDAYLGHLAEDYAKFALGEGLEHLTPDVKEKSMTKHEIDQFTLGNFVMELAKDSQGEQMLIYIYSALKNKLKIWGANADRENERTLASALLIYVLVIRFLVGEPNGREKAFLTRAGWFYQTTKTDFRADNHPAEQKILLALGELFRKYFSLKDNSMLIMDEGFKGRVSSLISFLESQKVEDANQKRIISFTAGAMRNLQASIFKKAASGR